MALRVICLCLLAVGLVAMVVSAVRYYRFIGYYRDERYDGKSTSWVAEYAPFALMLFFIFGFGVGMCHIVTTAVDGIYAFVCVVFCLGSLFIMNMVHVQIRMAASLREKTMDVMRGFVNSIEQKDPYTQGHSWHVYHIVNLFYDDLPGKVRQGVSKPKLLDAALLHDVGKIGVPGAILNKKGPLTDEEWVVIKSHPRAGAKMLEDTSFAEIVPWVMYHHERVDGTGYYGLPREDIPLEARIIAVADAYSAMTTDREYRPKRTHSQALEIMNVVSGSQLDAELVEYFTHIDVEALSALWEKVRQGALERQNGYPPYVKE